MNPPIIPFTKQQYDSLKMKVTTLFSKSHDGIDYSMPVGTPLMAAQNGVVSSVGKDTYGGYWLHIKGDDGRGYLYVHISKDVLGTDYAKLAKGGRKLPNKRVKQGEIVCYSGNTGKSTGPHLHWEIRSNSNNNSSSIDPSTIQVWSYKVGIGADPNKKPEPIPEPPKPDPKDQKIAELEDMVKNQAQEVVELKVSESRLFDQLTKVENELGGLKREKLEWDSKETGYIAQIETLEKKVKELEKVREPNHILAINKFLQWIKRRF